MPVTTRARAWNHLNDYYCKKCPNYMLCKNTLSPVGHKECYICTVFDIGMPYGASLLTAPHECCICLETEQTHVVLRCGHMIGLNCAQPLLCPQRGIDYPPSPCPDDYECPDEFDQDCDTYDWMLQDFRRYQRAKLATCPLCRTGII